MEWCTQSFNKPKPAPYLLLVLNTVTNLSRLILKFLFCRNTLQRIAK